MLYLRLQADLWAGRQGGLTPQAGKNNATKREL